MSEKRYVVDRIGGANGPGWFVREVVPPFGRYPLERAVELARANNEMALRGAEDALRTEIARVRYHRRRVRDGIQVIALDRTVRVERGTP